MPNHWWIPLLTSETGPAPAEPFDQTQASNYGQCQSHGAQRQQWIEDANAPKCPIAPSTLTAAQLNTAYRVRSYQGNHGFVESNNLFYTVGLPVEPSGTQNSAYVDKSIHDMNLSWSGYIGPGVVILDNIIRDEPAPSISEVTVAFYRAHHPIETLRHVVFGTVVNQFTIPVVKSLYNGITPSKTWWRSWAYGTAEYHALLGTRIGKMVCYIVLGGFPRGTRRIARIHTVFAYNLGNCHMHFEIAPIPGV